MQIIIESSNANHNWGDASMLHVAIRRLLRTHGDPRITILDENSSDVADSYVQRVTAANSESRNAWHNQRPVWHRFDDHIPGAVDYVTTAWPAIKERVTRAKMDLLNRDTEARAAFLRRFESADALVVTGGGFITDHFASAEKALNLILLAHSRDVPVFMFGQGIGPIRSSRLRKKAQRALPEVQLIALREQKSSYPLLRELGVSDGRITVTGDDAVALAHAERPDTLGRSIGVNLRVAYYSNVSEQTSDLVGRVCGTIANSHEAPLLPIPIAYEGHGSDVATIRDILATAGIDSDGGASLGSPEDVIRQVGRCRVVVTGSYHGGVFALSQGIPVVGLSQSEYYDNKFHGLADMFGAGCTVLRTDRPDFEDALNEAVRTAWDSAPDVRSQLLDAAHQQIQAADSAYKYMRDILSSTSTSSPISS